MKEAELAHSKAPSEMHSTKRTGSDSLSSPIKAFKFYITHLTLKMKSFLGVSVPSNSAHDSLISSRKHFHIHSPVINMSAELSNHHTVINTTCDI